MESLDLPSNPVSHISLLFGYCIVAFFIFKCRSCTLGLPRALEATEDRIFRLELLDIPKGRPFLFLFPSYSRIRSYMFSTRVQGCHIFMCPADVGVLPLRTGLSD